MILCRGRGIASGGTDHEKRREVPVVTRISGRSSLCSAAVCISTSVPVLSGSRGKIILTQVWGRIDSSYRRSSSEIGVCFENACDHYSGFSVAQGTQIPTGRSAAIRVVHWL